jgi:hypothetical protein
VADEEHVRRIRRVAKTKARAQVRAVTGLRDQVNFTCERAQMVGHKARDLIQTRLLARSRLALDQVADEFDDQLLALAEMFKQSGQGDDVGFWILDSELVALALDHVKSKI